MFKKKIGGDDGFNLVETMIAVCVMTILTGIAGLQYSVWVKRCNVEREAREMYAALMNARARALHMNRLHFVDFAAGQYTIYDDTYDTNAGAQTPDGDGILQKTDPGDDVLLRSRTFNTVVPKFAFGATKFYFNKNGLSSLDGSIRVSSDAIADYDCVAICATRIHLGKWNGTKCLSSL